MLCVRCTPVACTSVLCADSWLARFASGSPFTAARLSFADSAGLLQGSLTGGVWGSFVALQARAQRPEPHAFRQVVRISGGYTLGIGSLLALYNGASCATQQIRTSLISSGHTRHAVASNAAHHQEAAVDSLVGGFVAGFVASIPMHYRNAGAAAVTPSATAVAAAEPSAASMRPSSLLRRVRWSGCGRYGAAMALVGVLMHEIAQPDGVVLEKPRSAGVAMHSSRSSF